MRDVEIVLGLLVAVAALVALSRKLKIAYPIILVLGGLVLALVPGLPVIAIKPEIVFLLFLPPLLYWESLTSSLRDFRQNLRPISLLAIGLVLTTTLLIALAAHSLIHSLTWPAAFVLGAVLAPTDEAAVTEVSERLSIRRRVLIILEGESLVNDAISLVAYRMAIAAIVSGAFSLWAAGVQFVWITLAGVGAGLVVGWAVSWLRGQLPDDPSVETTVSLLTPFAAYLAAETLHASGVLAVVATGLYMGRTTPRIVDPETRIQAGAFWEMVTFLLNGLLFILTGLQLREILHSAARPSPLIFAYAALILAIIIAVRAVWVFANSYLPLLWHRNAQKPPWQSVALVAWVGIRGGLSLVAALAIPTVVAHGAPFPGRDLIICLSFLVILATLLLQGLTLPWAIRVLHLDDSRARAQEENRARVTVYRTGLAHLERVLEQQRADAPAQSQEKEADSFSLELLEKLRDDYHKRIAHFEARASGKQEKPSLEKNGLYHRLRRQLINVEHEKVVRMRDTGEIDDEVMRAIQHDLDLDALRIEDNPHA